MFDFCFNVLLPFVCWLLVVTELQTQSWAAGFPRSWSTMHDVCLDAHYRLQHACCSGRWRRIYMFILRGFGTALHSVLQWVCIHCGSMAQCSECCCLVALQLYRLSGIYLCRPSVQLWAATPLKLDPSSFWRTLHVCLFCVCLFDYLCNCKVILGAKGTLLLCYDYYTCVMFMITIHGTVMMLAKLGSVWQPINSNTILLHYTALYNTQTVSNICRTVLPG